MELKIGIIGGTGLDQDSSILSEKRLLDLEITPYGRPSDDQVISGVIEGVKVFILSRHGKDHSINPSQVNYRANLWALVKQLGCTHILVTSACGSLKEAIKPGDLGILNQYIDRTCGIRERSFYAVCHIEQKNPVSKTFQKIIEEVCEECKITCHKDLTAVTIEGPRFSTLAESNMHRSWGCDVVNMTSVPEVGLASELATIYSCILLITDYDCWREGEEGVTANLVIERMKSLACKVRKVIPGIIKRVALHDWSEEVASNKRSVEAAIMKE